MGLERGRVDLNEEFEGLAVEIGQSSPQPPVLERCAILVAGSHRSGTSALARVLSLIGCDLPKHVIPPLDGDNELRLLGAEAVVHAHDVFLAEHRFFVGRRGGAPGRSIRIGRSA